MERRPDNSVRIKVETDCQWTCTFCHNEGTELPQTSQGLLRTSAFLDQATRFLPTVHSMDTTLATFDQVARLRGLGINEAHLTGGEPTMHPEIAEIITKLSERGFEVKMTTNGQAHPKRFSEILRAPLSGVTFSILSLDPSEFLNTQNPPNIPGINPLAWATKMIEREQVNILAAKDSLVEVKINTAVLGERDYPRVDTVLEFAQTYGLTLVLLNSIGDGEEAEQAVLKYAQRHGVLVGQREFANSSKGSRSYQTADGQQIREKYFREYQPDVVCAGCEH